MNDELNNKSGSTETTDDAQDNICAKCKKEPCVCPTDNEADSNADQPRQRLPKVSWI